MKNNISIKTLFLLFVTIGFWASAFVGIRAALHSYSPGSLALLRYAIASFCMFFIYRWFGRKDFISVKDKLLLMLVGAVGIGWYNIALNYGEVTVTSGTASFIISQGPIITSVLAMILLGEQGSWLSFFGMGVSIFGVFLISVGEAHGLRWEPGIGFILFSTLIGGFYSILQKPFLKKYHAIDVTAYVIWGCTFSLLVYFPDLFHDVRTATANGTLAVVYLGIFPAAIAYAAWSYVLAEIPASRAVSFLYFAPIITILLGWLFLKEVPAVISIIGGLIALFGVYMVNRSYQGSTKLAVAATTK